MSTFTESFGDAGLGPEWEYVEDTGGVGAYTESGGQGHLDATGTIGDLGIQTVATYDLALASDSGIKVDFIVADRAVWIQCSVEKIAARANDSFNAISVYEYYRFGFQGADDEAVAQYSDGAGNRTNEYTDFSTAVIGLYEIQFRNTGDEVRFVVDGSEVGTDASDQRDTGAEAVNYVQIYGTLDSTDSDFDFDDFVVTFQAAAGANPHGPFGHPFHGSFGGPVA